MICSNCIESGNFDPMGITSFKAIQLAHLQKKDTEPGKQMAHGQTTMNASGFPCCRVRSQTNEDHLSNMKEHKRHYKLKT